MVNLDNIITFYPNKTFKYLIPTLQYYGVDFGIVFCARMNKLCSLERIFVFFFRKRFFCLQNGILRKSFWDTSQNQLQNYKIEANMNRH